MSLLLVPDMSLFYTELLARLCSLATPFPSVIGRLCSQCEEWLLTCPEPILLPKCSFLQQPGGALRHTLTGLKGGQKYELYIINMKKVKAELSDLWFSCQIQAWNLIYRN